MNPAVPSSGKQTCGEGAETPPVLADGLSGSARPAAEGGKCSEQTAKPGRCTCQGACRAWTPSQPAARSPRPQSSCRPRGARWDPGPKQGSGLEARVQGRRQAPLERCGDAPEPQVPAEVRAPGAACRSPVKERGWGVRGSGGRGEGRGGQGGQGKPPEAGGPQWCFTRQSSARGFHGLPLRHPVEIL